MILNIFRHALTRRAKSEIRDISATVLREFSSHEAGPLHWSLLIWDLENLIQSTSLKRYDVDRSDVSIRIMPPVEFDDREVVRRTLNAYAMLDS